MVQYAYYKIRKFSKTMENNVLKVLEEIRDLQRETVENQKQSLVRNEQAMNWSKGQRKITLAVLAVFIVYMVFMMTM